MAETEYPVRIEKFTFTRLTGFRDGFLTFKAGVNVICGGNGAGKSTLLHTLYDVLKHSGAVCEEAAIGASHRATTATLEVAAKIHKATATIKHENGASTMALGDAEKPKTFAYFIDAASEVVRLREKVARTDNLDEALQQVETADQNDDYLERVAYFMGRTYSKVSIAEIDLGHDFEEAPFFRVTTGDISYDSRHMGLGEFTIMYLLWRLDRIRSTSISLIEEPEVFMSPLSQLRFANILADLSDKKKIWFIVSTHSPSLVTQVGEQQGCSVQLLHHSGSNGEVTDGPNVGAMLRSLGMVPAKRFFLVVEDASSTRWLRFLLASEDVSLMDTIQIVTAGGDGDVVSLAERWEKCKGFTLAAVFLLDGDMMAKKPDWASATRLFLPGELEPELVVKHQILSSIDEFAKAIDRPSAGVKTVIGQIDGIDLHDWAPTLADRLGISLETVFTNALVLWRSNGANKTTASAFISALQQALLASEKAILAT